LLFLNHPLAAPGVAALVALVAGGLGLLLPTSVVLVWMEEHGPVERWTLMLYFLAALGVCGDRERLKAPAWLAIVTLLVAAVGRELDWHKSFTEVSIFKVGYYLGAAPVPHKLAALATLLPVGLSGIWLAWRFAPPLWRGLRRGHPPAWTVLTLLVVLALCKLADRSLGVLSEDFGVRSSGQARALQLSLEESLELALPALVLLWLVQGRAVPGGHGAPQPPARPPPPRSRPLTTPARP
jgi:hypothetical protein